MPQPPVDGSATTPGRPPGRDVGDRSCCSTTASRPTTAREVGRAAVRVLEAGGYRVELAGLALLRPAGDLERACSRSPASPWPVENVARSWSSTRAGLESPILGCEPSCLLTLVDEYRDFRIGPDADLVASASKLVDTFVSDRSLMPDLPLTPASEKVLLHGHCQQKALVGTAGTVAALRRIEGLEVKELDSGCCGMAGSFGYELGHYEMSTALANRVLLPACRAEPAARLVAPGFSCRSQLHGLAGIEALHPIEFIAERLTTR